MLFRSAALDAGKAKGAEIQQFGDAREYMVRIKGDTSQTGAEKASQEIKKDIATVVGEQGFRVDRSEAVGPRVGAELRRGAILAILVSFAITLVYLAWRFEWRFGLAAVMATASRHAPRAETSRSARRTGLSLSRRWGAREFQSGRAGRSRVRVRSRAGCRPGSCG